VSPLPVGEGHAAAVAAAGDVTEIRCWDLAR
jgi:hypothetical protein